MQGVKKIAYLIPHSELAGGERIILDLCTHLDKNKFQPFVILPREGGLAKKFIERGIRVSIIPFRRDFIAGFPPAFSIFSMKAIFAQLSEWKIDLLHLNDSYLSLMGGIVGKLLHIPVTLTGHGIWDSHFLIQDFFNRAFLEEIWVPTEQVRNAILRRKIINTKIVHKIPFGVDTKIFSPRDSEEVKKQLGIPKNVIVITRVARFDSVKDYPTFLIAAEQIALKHEQVRFLVLGDNILNIQSEGRSNKHDFLTFLDQRPLLKQRFTYLGHRDDVSYYLGISDILVSSSLSESFGMNIVEAMAMGIAVVSTSVGGPSEIIEDGVSGMLVPPKDSMALSEAVIHLIGNQARRKEMGQQAHRRILESFNLDTFIRLMQERYQKLLSPN